MNKIILTLLMTILFTPAANAQNCVNSSRCDELGYNKKAENCIDDDILKCPFDSNKVFCRTQEQPAATNCLNAKIGDILYSDKTCSSDYIAGKTPIAVIFAPERRLAVALDEFAPEQWKGSWNGMNPIYDKLDIPSIPNYGSAEEALQDFNGKSYTYAAYNFCYFKDTTTEICAKDNPSAVKTAYEYMTPGTEKHDWYLPALGELNELLKNAQIINQTLGKLNALLICPTGSCSYVSTSESYISSLEGRSVWYCSTVLNIEVHCFTCGKEALRGHETIARPVLAF